LKRENVARLTSVISSSSRVVIRNRAESRENRSSTDPAVGAVKGVNGISAVDPPVDAAKETPAIPSTDRALPGRLLLGARFDCGIEEFLLYFPLTSRATNPLHPLALFVRLEQHDSRRRVRTRKQMSAIANRQFSHLARRVAFVRRSNRGRVHLTLNAAAAPSFEPQIQTGQTAGQEARQPQGPIGAKP
jgi:hypothetical protein